MAGISGALISDPSQLAGLNPGANTSGGPGPVVTPASSPTTAIGGTSQGNPMIPSMPPGGNINPSAMPAYDSPYSTSGATSLLAGLGGGTGGPGGTNTFGAPNSMAMQNDIAKGLQKAGYKGGQGTALAEFLQSGAGYNPAVAQSLIAALQPQIEKGRANLMEQFGSHGLGMSSPAALGMGDYLAQTNLDVGQLLSGLYEQSVQNYMQVLTSAKDTHTPFWQTLVGDLISGGSQVAKGFTPNG